MGDGRKLYRDLVDRLVRSCREGQGQIAAKRARAGSWNPNADRDPSAMPDQAAMNDLLKRLTDGDRQLLAHWLAQQFVSGVHETLTVLHESQVPPFEEGYEGSPAQDFLGRLADWPWPDGG